jgi:hypothetical protein
MGIIRIETDGETEVKFRILMFQHIWNTLSRAPIRLSQFTENLVETSFIFSIPAYNRHPLLKPYDPTPPSTALFSSSLKIPPSTVIPLHYDNKCGYIGLNDVFSSIVMK